MVTSKKVYIEPSVFFAFIDRAHPKHDEAAAFFRYFAQEEYQIYTDDHSLIEVYNKLYTEISPSLAKDFLRIMALSDINMLYTDENDAKAALKTLITYQSLDLTYHKALIATLAERRNIPQICTFDYFHALFGLNLFYLPI